MKSILFGVGLSLFSTLFKLYISKNKMSLWPNGIIYFISMAVVYFIFLLLLYKYLPNKKITKN